MRETNGSPSRDNILAWRGWGESLNLKQCSWSLNPVVGDKKQECYPLDSKVRASRHGAGRKVCHPLSIMVALVGLRRCKLRTSCERKCPENVTQPQLKLTVWQLLTGARRFTNDAGTHFSLACNTNTFLHRVCRHATKHLGYIYKWFFQSFVKVFPERERCSGTYCFKHLQTYKTGDASTGDHVGHKFRSHRITKELSHHCQWNSLCMQLHHVAENRNTP